MGFADTVVSSGFGNIRGAGAIAACVLGAAIFLSPIAVAQSPREIARDSFQSVVLLELNDAEGQPLSLGSGFFVGDGIVATNAHVIAGASSGSAKLVGRPEKLRILGSVAVDQHSDLALLKVDGAAPALRLSQGAVPVVGDKVFVVGNPLGLEGTFSDGIISGVRSVQSDSILQMTAPISPGSSGGPVMDASGAVIGVAEATFRDGQNLNLAVPASYLAKLLSNAAPHLTVSSLAARGASGATEDSIVDRIGTRLYTGVLVSNFKLTYISWQDTYGGFELRINNRLPIAVSNVKLRIIYRDAAGSVMDFEDYEYSGMVPPGLSKTVVTDHSEEAGRALHYYFNHGPNGSELPPPTSDNNYNAFAEKMQPKVEIRVIGFDTDASD